MKRYGIKSWCLCFVKRSGIKSWYLCFVKRNGIKSWCLCFVKRYGIKLWCLCFVKRYGIKSCCLCFVKLLDCVSWQAYLPPKRPPPHSRPGFARRADKAPSPYCRSRTVNPANRRDAHCKKLAMKWLSLKNFKGYNTLWQLPKWVGIIYKEWLEIKLTWRKVIIKQITVK